jgi:hypothetical protein
MIKLLLPDEWIGYWQSQSVDRHANGSGGAP